MLEDARQCMFTKIGALWLVKIVVLPGGDTGSTKSFAAGLYKAPSKQLLEAVIRQLGHIKADGYDACSCSSSLMCVLCSLQISVIAQAGHQCR